MSQSQRKLQPLHIEAIWEWRQPGSRRKTLREIRERLAKGSKDWPPVDVTEETIRATYERVADDRGLLYSTRNRDKAPSVRLDLLTKRLINVAERETARVERAERGGKLDANRLLKLARAMRGLYDLHDRAERQADDDEQPASPPRASTSFADQLVSAVPDDHPHQDTAQGNGDIGTGDGVETPEAAQTIEVGRRFEQQRDGDGGSRGDVAVADGGDHGRVDFASDDLNFASDDLSASSATS